MYIEVETGLHYLIQFGMGDALFPDQLDCALHKCFRVETVSFVTIPLRIDFSIGVYIYISCKT